VSDLSPLDTTSSGGGGTSLTISGAKEILGDCHLGDSIAINGTCLTVTEFDEDSFKVGVAPETLRRTNLGSLVQNSKVNLERAVSASTRMGGHFVQGHVDTVATIARKTPDGNAITFRLQARDKEVLRYVVEKGFVTLDGASLTVTQVNDAEGWWEVMLIAYTQERVVMASKKEGDGVNVEVDMVGKYVEKSVQGYFEGLSSVQDGGPAILEKIVSRLVEQELKNSS
jgi:riboflavin synthase